MGLKHYNSGSVWGIIKSVQQKKSKGNGTPFLNIEIKCDNEIYGNIRTFGRLWKKERIKEFNAFYKKHPKEAYYFRGFFNQYSRDNITYSNYTFFDWKPFDGSEFKASFVLVGDVSSTDTVDDRGILSLHLSRPGAAGFNGSEENFELYTLNAQEIDGINDGSTIKTKGYLRYKKGMDSFGEQSGEIKPYVMDISFDKSEDPF